MAQSTRKDFDPERIIFPKRNFEEIIIQNNIDDVENDKYWMQMFDNIWIKHLYIDTTNNVYANLLYCTEQFNGALHYHTGTVYAYIINGIYGHFESNGKTKEYSADTGSFVFAPVGSVHQPYMKPYNGYFLGFSVNHGSIIYLNDDHKMIGYSDVHTQVSNLKKHYSDNNIPEKELNLIIK